MNKTMKTLDSLRPGEAGTVYKLKNSGDMRRRLIDLGFAEKSRVWCIGTAPFGDPKAFYIKGSVIALREDDSKNIIICNDQEKRLRRKCGANPLLLRHAHR